MDPIILTTGAPFAASITAPDTIELKLDPGAGIELNADTKLQLDLGGNPPYSTTIEPAGMSTPMSMGIGIGIGVAVSALVVGGIVWWARRSERQQLAAAVAHVTKVTTPPPPAATAQPARAAA